MSQAKTDDRQSARELEAIKEGSRVAVRTATAWLVAGAPLLLLVMLGLRSSLIAADAMYRGGGEHWYEAAMPAVLFAFYGAVFGCVLGWRMASTSGMSGPVAWGIGMGAVALLVVAGGVMAAFLFPGGIPVMLWVSFGAMAISAATGVSVFTIWGGE